MSAIVRLRRHTEASWRDGRREKSNSAQQSGFFGDTVRKASWNRTPFIYVCTMCDPNQTDSQSHRLSEQQWLTTGALNSESTASLGLAASAKQQ